MSWRYSACPGGTAHVLEVQRMSGGTAHLWGYSACPGGTAACSPVHVYVSYPGIMPAWISTGQHGYQLVNMDINT